MIGVSVAQPDVTLILDGDGVITGATVSNDIAGEGVAGLVGRSWPDTVGEVGGAQVRRMLADARASGFSAFGQVCQRFPSGLELPIEYTTVRLAGRPGLIAIGKNLQSVAELQARLIAAQQAREQEYWKLREVETRYRLLFDASSEAVLIVRAETMRVAELNLAAIRGLGLAPDADVLGEIAPDEREAVLAMLGRVREQGRAPGIIVHLGRERLSWTMRASLLTSEPGSAFLLQFGPVSQAAAAAPVVGSPNARPNDLFASAAWMDRLPDGVVIVDRDGVIKRANSAFLDLVQAGVEASVLGERLGRWLSQPGSDATVLLATVQRTRAVRNFSSVLQGELGTELEVEIAAVAEGEGAQVHVALILRNVTRRASRQSDGSRVATAFGNIGDRLGSASLISVVRDTVATVEQEYIAEALARVGHNRTAAAELLGMSRQSLHAKLNRYGLDGMGDDAEG